MGRPPGPQGRPVEATFGPQTADHGPWAEDGVTISQRLGRVPFYVVVTVEGGKSVSHETCSKMGHAQFAVWSRPASGR